MLRNLKTNKNERKRQRVVVTVNQVARKCPYITQSVGPRIISLIQKAQ